MNSRKTMLLLSTIALTLGSSISRADFGELDIMVQESVENYFKEYGRAVDLNSVDYSAEPQLADGIMTLQTMVKAQQGFTGGWGWHYCTTHIQIDASRALTDLGSECVYEME